MRRRLFNYALIASLALSMATAGLWVRSCFVSDILYCENYDNLNEFAIGTARGGVCLARVWPAPNRPKGSWAIHYSQDPPLDHYPSTVWPLGFSGHDAFGFGWAYESDYKAGMGKTKTPAAVVIVPHALLLVLFGTAASYFLIPWRRTRRKAKRFLAGLCAQCGYDIRATPTRCPECGHVQIPASKV